jgi:hypothetical protein
VAADLAVGREQAREGHLERRRLGALLELDGDRGGLLLEQPRPGAAAGQRLLGEHLLLGLGEQVRAVAARRAEMVAREVEPVCGQQLLRALVVEPRPLELEEEQRGLDRGAALLDLLEQGTARGVGGVLGEAEHRVGARAADALLDLAELLHGGHERGAVHLGHVAGVLGRERLRALERLFQQCVDRGGGVLAGPVEQVAEVPGNRLELGVGGFGRAHGAASVVG